MVRSLAADVSLSNSRAYWPVPAGDYCPDTRPFTMLAEPHPVSAGGCWTIGAGIVVLNAVRVWPEVLPLAYIYLVTGTLPPESAGADSPLAPRLMLPDHKRCPDIWLPSGGAPDGYQCHRGRYTDICHGLAGPRSREQFGSTPVPAGKCWHPWCRRYHTRYRSGHHLLLCLLAVLVAYTCAAGCLLSWFLPTHRVTIP